jgi:hypothetical protein
MSEGSEIITELRCRDHPSFLVPSLGVIKHMDSGLVQKYNKEVEGVDLHYLAFI